MKDPAAAKTAVAAAAAEITTEHNIVKGQEDFLSFSDIQAKKGKTFSVQNFADFVPPSP